MAAPRSAGAVVFRRTESGVKLLVLRAYRNWDFPKGLIDEGETPFATAQREVTEETGIVDLDFPFGEEFKETLPYSDNKIARYYLAETGDTPVRLPISPELGRPEHHEFRWVGLEEAEDVLPPRLSIVLEWVKKTLAG